MLSTFSFLPEMDTHMWEANLLSLFEEWGINTEKISAAVCSMEHEAMVETIASMGIPVVPCLDFSIKVLKIQILKKFKLIFFF